MARERSNGDGAAGVARRLAPLVLMALCLVAGGRWLLGCGGSGSGNGTKCSQCGDTDGPCDRPDLSKAVCWNDDQKACCETRRCLRKCPSGNVCDEDADCSQAQRCEDITGECSDDGAPCAADSDCAGEGATCERIGTCSEDGEDCKADEDCVSIPGQCGPGSCEPDTQGNTPACSIDADCETCVQGSCWNDSETACSGECPVNPCLEFRECEGSGEVCSSNADCGTGEGTCVTVKRCMGGRDKKCESNDDCTRCAKERLACLRKLGSAERICFALNLDNVPELQCGERFSLAGGTQRTPTPTPTRTPTPTSTRTPTPTSTP